MKKIVTTKALVEATNPELLKNPNVLVEDYDKATSTIKKPQWEKDIEAFRKSKPSVEQVIARFPVLARFRSLLISIEKHPGKFCHLETVKHSLKKGNEVIKLTSHNNLQCNLTYENKKVVQQLHETGKRTKTGKLTGRKSILPWLYVLASALEDEFLNGKEVSEQAFTFGFAPALNYRPVSKYQLKGKELTRDEAIELGGSAFKRSTVPLLNEKGEKVLDENGKVIRIPTPKSEMNWFTPKLVNVLDFKPSNGN